MASDKISVPTLDPSASDMQNLPIEESQVAQPQQISPRPIELKYLPPPGNSEQQDPSIGGPTSVQSRSSQQHVATHDVTSTNHESQPAENQNTMNFLNFDPQVSTSTDKASAEAQPSVTRLTRTETAPAIGPATDKPTLITKEATDEPALFITLLLASTGARHPYKLDGKYLAKRSVEVEGNNPINMSLYKLKELILRDWRSEWDAKPSNPESIRLIFRGKMLNDKSRLADNGFINGQTPQIVHMAIKPQEIVDEEEANKAIGKDRDGTERSPGCRCVIQ